MTERYDAIAAAHYAAYRPPLHSMILGRVLSRAESLGTGLDVGCGTGYSAVALAGYCGRVYGVDPSPAMLRETREHERVSYLGGAAERIPLPDDAVDVVTFAGSLFYCDAGAAVAEVKRVGRDGSLVIAYDFEVLLDDALRACGVEPRTAGSEYDHRRNFSGAPGLAERVVRSERVEVPVSASEIAHLLLSDSHRYDALAGRHRASDPFPVLVDELRSEYARGSVEAEIYYSAYRLTNGERVPEPVA